MSPVVLLGTGFSATMPPLSTLTSWLQFRSAVGDARVVCHTLPLQEANAPTHQAAYGNDRFSSQALSLMRSTFGEGTVAVTVGTGTSANVLGLAAARALPGAPAPLPRGRGCGIVCARFAHMAVDETGAPEEFLGAKLLTVNNASGKVYS